MTQQPNSTNNIQETFNRFVRYGYLLGISIPMMLVIVISIASDDKSIFEAFTPESIKLIQWIAVTQLFLVFFLLFVGSTPKSDKLITYTLYVSGVISLISLHFLVSLTGGAMQSVFSTYYLYIPVVVAITFRKPRSLIISGVTCFLSLTYNTFYYSIDLDINKLESMGAYQWIFYVVTVSQLSTALFIEYKKIKNA